MSFCMNCGRQLNEGEICTCLQAPVQKKKNKKPFIIIPAAVLLVAAICFLTIFLAKEKSAECIPSWFDSAFESNSITLTEVKFDFIEDKFDDDYNICSISPDGTKMLCISDEMFIADVKNETITPVVKDLENSVDTEQFSSGKYLFEMNPRLILDGDVVWSPDGRYLSFVSWHSPVRNMRWYDFTLIDTTDGSWRALEATGKNFLDKNLGSPISACFNDNGNILYYIEYGNRNEMIYTLKQYDLEKKEITVLKELQDMDQKIDGEGDPYDTLRYYKGDLYYSKYPGGSCLMKLSEKNGEWSVEKIPLLNNSRQRTWFQIANTGTVLALSESLESLSFRSSSVHVELQTPDPLFVLVYVESPDSEAKLLTTTDYTTGKVGVDEYTFETYPRLTNPNDIEYFPGAVSMSPDGKYALVSMVSAEDYHMMLLNLESFEWNELKDVGEYFGPNDSGRSGMVKPFTDNHPYYDYYKIFKWVSGNRILACSGGSRMHVLEFTQE